MAGLGRDGFTWEQAYWLHMVTTSVANGQKGVSYHYFRLLKVSKPLSWGSSALTGARPESTPSLLLATVFIGYYYLV